MLRCNGSLGPRCTLGYALCPTQIRKLSATWQIWSLCDRATHCLAPLRRYYAALQHTWPTIFRLEVGRVLPTTKGDHESRPTGSLQVHLCSAILENSARCSGDSDVFLSTLSEQSRRAGPIGCALHTATSDLGRGR